MNVLTEGLFVKFYSENPEKKFKDRIINFFIKIWTQFIQSIYTNSSIFNLIQYPYNLK